MKKFFMVWSFLLLSQVVVYAGAGADYEVTHEAAEESDGSGILGTILMFGTIWVVGTVWQKISDDKKDSKRN